MPVPSVSRSDPHQLLLLGDVIDGVPDLVVKVGAKDAKVEPTRVAQLQLPGHVVQHLIGRGSGEGEDRRSAHRLDRGTEAEEGRTEVVAPLREAMCLVDDEEIDLDRLQDVDEGGIFQSLRRGEHELDFAGLERSQRILELCGIDRGVHLARFHAERIQLVGLILHQGDQRRDHDRRPGKVQCRQLVTQRLARAGRHHRDRVAAFDDGTNDLFLARAGTPPGRTFRA